MKPLPPIIFIHRGYNDYLQWNLRHIAAKFPGRQVVTISDVQYEATTWVPFPKNKKTLFDPIYVHLSNVDKKFELFCFNRWFILLDILKKKDIGEFIHLDSDCVLYDDQFPCDKLGVVGDPKSPYYAFTKSGHSLFSNQKSLEKFCDFIVETYTVPQKLEALKILRTTKISSTGGGVTDMTLFGLYAQNYPHEVRHQEAITENCCSDDNFNASGGFELDGYHKKIIMENGQPFGLLKATGEKIKFRTLHFQGSAKRWMVNYFEGNAEQYKPLGWMKTLWKHKIYAKINFLLNRI